MSNDLAVQNEVLTPEVLEAVVVGGDLSKLTAKQRVLWYKARCDAADLDVRIQPFIYLHLNGKLQLYATKAASDALIAKHRLNVELPSEKYDAELGIYKITCKVTKPDGTSVEDFGAVFIAGLKGENLCNALLKCCTKAKRRTVLSACGLGMPDESEAELETIATIQPPRQIAAPTSEGAAIPTAIEVELPGQPQSGPDSRTYADVVKAAVEATNNEIGQMTEDGEMPLEVGVADAHRHMINDIIQRQIHTGSTPTTSREAATILSKAYKLHRDEMRNTLLAFLNGKLDEAEAILEAKKQAKTMPIQEATSEPAPAPRAEPPAPEPKEAPPEPAEPPPPPQQRRGRQAPPPSREMFDEPHGEGPDD